MLIIIILKIEKRIIGNAKMKSKIQSVRFITHMAGLTAIVPFTFTLAGKAINHPVNRSQIHEHGNAVIFRFQKTEAQI